MYLYMCVCVCVKEYIDNMKCVEIICFGSMYECLCMLYVYVDEDVTFGGFGV